jgi:hypothetical protein
MVVGIGLDLDQQLSEPRRVIAWASPSDQRGAVPQRAWNPLTTHVVRRLVHSAGCFVRFVP